jgi:hypothetical protein
MAYYSKITINGEEFSFAVNIVGSGAPTSSIEANVGMFYMNSDDGSVYKCVGTGVWEPIVSAEQFATAVENYFVENPVEDGKSAYAYAQEGGYEGTEEEFTKKLAENPDWVATKKVDGGEELYISQQTLSSGMWSKLQMHFQVGITYDVHFNGEIYPCVANNEDGGIFLGNVTLMDSTSTKPHNNEPFCVYWAGAGATSGFFYKASTVSYPVTLKVTSHANIVYNKMPKEYLPDNIGGGGASIDVTAEVGQTIIVKEVDANGKPTRWESADYQPRTHYMETILPETEGVLNEEMGGYMLPLVTLEGGKTYTVNYNGVEYDCVSIGFDGVGVVLGNAGAMDENFVPTSDPFICVLQIDTMFAVIPLDGAETVKVSIKAAKPIPQQYLTNAFPYYIEATCSQREDGQFDVYVSETVAEVTELMHQGREIRVRLNIEDSAGNRNKYYFYMVIALEHQGVFSLSFQCEDNPFEANGDRASRLIFTPNLDGSYSIADTPW